MIGPFQANTPCEPLSPTIPQEAPVTQLTPEKPTAFVQYVVAVDAPSRRLHRKRSGVADVQPAHDRAHGRAGSTEDAMAFPDCGIRTRTGPTMPSAGTGANPGTAT